jgi:hypothetical protein
MRSSAHFAVFVSMVGCAHPITSVSDERPVVSSRPQSDPRGGSVFVGCGYLLIEDRGATSFTILLTARQARHIPSDIGALYTLDNILVETQSTTAAEIGAPSLRGMDLLMRHQAWELDYTAKAQGWPPISPATSAPDLRLDGIETLAWSYCTPRPFELLGQTVTTVAYLTAAIDDVVFVLAAALRETDDVRLAARVMAESMRTLRRTERALDLQEVSAKLKASRDPWPGCAELGQ